MHFVNFIGCLRDLTGGSGFTKVKLFHGILKPSFKHGKPGLGDGPAV
jgi:hypothetical protein